MKITRHLHLYLLFSLLVPLVFGACRLTPPSPSAPEETTSLSQTPAAIEEPTMALPADIDLSKAETKFADFNEVSADITRVATFPAAASDLSNVRNSFILSKSQLDFLARNGFVVSPGTEKEFFTVYEKARYDNLPIFVTSDSLLHTYHLLFDKVLRTAELEHFIPLLRELNQALLFTVDQQYQALKGTTWEDAALRSVAFIGVASKLLDASVQVPAYAQELINQEIALIEDASGIFPSPLFPGLENGEDYTQYIPRGHYTLRDELKAYFKSMMWYGRMTFRLDTKDPEVGRAETRTALLIVLALRTSQVRGQPAFAAWQDLYNPTVFFVGRSDDLTVMQYDAIFTSVYGKEATPNTVADEAKLNQFIDLARRLPPPRILGMVIMDTDDEEETTKGMRFMGQRFVPDAYIFRQLIYRNVGTQDNRRGLPKGLDLMAAMGSERAYQILDQMGETSYPNYKEQMLKVKTWLAGLTLQEWTETLYNSWLYTFFPLLAVPPVDYPHFTQSQAWLDKQLNTVLGSWTELKHDTILYAKQVYAELGGGPPPPEPLPPRGYVEPVPVFFARLAALTAMTRTGLESRGLLSDLDKSNLEKLENLANALKGMAEKELRGEPLSEEEYQRLRFYGGELEELVMASADTDQEDPFAPKYMEEEPQAAVIADVATDPDPAGSGASEPVVLEEGVGRINEIFVVVPIFETDGSSYLQVAKGGVFSYYEFPWPANDRLTDEKWRQMLDTGQAPPLPEWTASFFTKEGEYSDIQQAVFRFHNNLVAFYWYPDMNPEFSGDWTALAQFAAERDALFSSQRFIGKQLVWIHFKSFDLQSQNTAVVTAQESWQDTLNEGDLYGDYKNISQRGPYTLEVTYTVLYNAAENYWYVQSAIYASQPPGW